MSLVLTTIAMMLSTVDASAAASDSKVSICDELVGIQLLDKVTIDPVAMEQKALDGKSIALSFHGQAVSFRLSPTCLDEAASPASSARVYEGTGSGLEYLQCTFTDNWVRVTFMMNGIDYSIEPLDGTGASGYYAVYTSDSVKSGVSGLDDTISVPQSGSGAQAVTQEPVNVTSAPELLLVNDTQGTVDSTFHEEAQGIQDRIKTPLDNETCAGGLNDPQYRMTRIIMACDVEFRTLYPTDWDARMRSTLSSVCTRYESQTGVSFVLVIAPYAVPSGYCTSTDATNLLTEFRTFARSDPTIGPLDRDLCHLFTGKNLDGDWIGMSYAAGVGTKRWGDDFAYSISEQWHGSLQNYICMGHELGHNFNADHPFWTSLGGGSKSWMYSPYTTSVVAQFSTNNANRVRSWSEQNLDTYRSYVPGPSSISAENLQVDNFLIEGGCLVYQVGVQWRAYFNIINKGSQAITLDLLFVGARDGSGANRDFGQITNIVINPGAYYGFNCYYTPQSGGAWTLWPAYRIGGTYGPYQWMPITATVYYDQGEVDGMYSTGTPEAIDYLYRFYLFTTVQTPHVGDSVTVYSSMYDGKAGTSTDTFTYFFAACRNAQGANRDFGHSGTKTLTQDASSITGGGCLVFSTRVLDTQGLWVFWPCYKTTGGVYGPQQIQLSMMVYVP